MLGTRLGLMGLTPYKTQVLEMQILFKSQVIWYFYFRVKITGIQDYLIYFCE